jgi:hypothetical protein
VCPFAVPLARRSARCLSGLQGVGGVAGRRPNRAVSWTQSLGQRVAPEGSHSEAPVGSIGSAQSGGFPRSLANSYERPQDMASDLRFCPQVGLPVSEHEFN